MEQQGYLRIFRERWLTVLISTISGVALAALIAFLVPPTYAATSTLLLTVQSRQASLSDRSTFSLERISSYPELVYSPEVLGGTIDDLGLPLTQSQLADRITASNPSTTVLLRIRAESDTAAGAAELANTLARNVAALVDDIENSSRNSGSIATLELTNPASAPTRHVAPQRSLILGLGLLAGLSAGLVAAIIRSRTDTSIRTVDRVRHISGLPVLGQWSTTQKAHGHHDSGGDAPETRSESTLSPLDRQLRDTQLALQQASANGLPRLLLLAPAESSALSPDDATGFARSLADTGRNVCLIENGAPLGITANAPKGRVSKGLAGVLREAQPLRAAALPVQDERFSLLPAGDISGAPGEQVTAERMPALATQLLKNYDIAIIAAESGTRPLALDTVASAADGVVAVVRHGVTREAELLHTLSRLRLAGATPLGVVMTGVPPRRTVDLVASWVPSDFAAASATTAAALDSTDAATPDTTGH